MNCSGSSGWTQSPGRALAWYSNRTRARTNSLPDSAGLFAELASRIRFHASSPRITSSSAIFMSYSSCDVYPSPHSTMSVRVEPAGAARLGADPGVCAGADPGRAIMKIRPTTRNPADSALFNSSSFFQGNSFCGFCTTAVRCVLAPDPLLPRSCGDPSRRRIPHFLMPNPHFSRAFYCGGGSEHVCCVVLRRAPRRTVEYVCRALGLAPCIHARLRRLATKPREKCGLAFRQFLLQQIVNNLRIGLAFGLPHHLTDEKTHHLCLP